VKDCDATSQRGPRQSLFSRFLDHTHKHARTRTHTHKAGKFPLNVWSACRRGHYLHNTKQTQETNIHALSGNRTRNLGNQAAAGHRHRQCTYASVKRCFSYRHTQNESLLCYYSLDFYWYTSACHSWKCTPNTPLCLLFWSSEV